MRPRNLVAEIHPATERPAHLELADRTRLEPDQGDRVVLVVDRVDEGVGRAHHLDRAIALADEAPDDLDAVATEVDDRAAAGQPAVPEPGAVRPRMRLTRPDPGDVADRPVLDRRDCLQALRRVAEVLEIATEHARLLNGVEHPPCLRRRPTERLRAEDGLAGRGSQPDRFFVEVVREADDDDVGVIVLNRRLQIRRVLRDRPALPERRASLL